MNKYRIPSCLCCDGKRRSVWVTGILDRHGWFAPAHTEVAGVTVSGFVSFMRDEPQFYPDLRLLNGRLLA